MDRNYLKKLFGFITSRKTNQEWTQNALNYGYDLEKSKKYRQINIYQKF
ncbi:MAG: hypothetical protein QXM68_03005 [Candidatus Aenigmatarchaeota archaeon]|nr:hypothetical protein [Candidatus Aenigmarchaeota archaeon]